MNQFLIRRFIKETLLQESIKGKRGVSSEFGTHFDMSKFKSYDGIPILQEYARTFLEVLGTGSSRATYLLSMKKVLKIAMNEKGIAQNKAEVSVSKYHEEIKANYEKESSLGNLQVVTHVYENDPNFQWVIAELVRPLKEEGGYSEFKRLTNTSWSGMMDLLETINNSQKISKSLKTIGLDDPKRSQLEKQYEKTLTSYDTALSQMTSGSRDYLQVDPGFVKLAVEIKKKFNPIMGDLKAIEHWGKTANGSIVLLDSGATEDVWNQHYAQKPQDKDLGNAEKATGK